jgi:hypothetical protein
LTIQDKHKEKCQQTLAGFDGCNYITTFPFSHLDLEVAGQVAVVVVVPLHAGNDHVHVDDYAQAGEAVAVASVVEVRVVAGYLEQHQAEQTDCSHQGSLQNCQMGCTGHNQVQPGAHVLVAWASVEMSEMSNIYIYVSSFFFVFLLSEIPLKIF